jgi:hypothetical protein
VSDITVTAINYHPNGSPEAGRTCLGFYAVNFTDPEMGAMMAVVFPPREFEHQFDGLDWKAAAETPHKPCVAVFRVSALPDLNTNRNSWAGDQYYPDLYLAIGHYYSHFGSPICASNAMRGDIVLDGVNWRTVTDIIEGPQDEHVALVLDGEITRTMHGDTRIHRSVTPSAN